MPKNQKISEQAHGNAPGVIGYTLLQNSNSTRPFMEIEGVRVLLFHLNIIHLSTKGGKK